MTKKEFLVQDDSPVLKEFIKTNSEQLESLIKDSKTAQVSLQFISNLHATLNNMLSHTNTHMFAVPVFLQEAYGSLVEYFGENPKTTQPSAFFPLFGRFIKAYKVRMCGRFLTCVQPRCVALNFNCFFSWIERRRHSNRFSRKRKWRVRAVRKNSRHLPTKLGYKR